MAVVALKRNWPQAETSLWTCVSGTCGCFRNFSRACSTLGWCARYFPYYIIRYAHLSHLKQAIQLCTLRNSDDSSITVSRLLRLRSRCTFGNALFVTQQSHLLKSQQAAPLYSWVLYECPRTATLRNPAYFAFGATVNSTGFVNPRVGMFLFTAYKLFQYNIQIACSAWTCFWISSPAKNDHTPLSDVTDSHDSLLTRLRDSFCFRADDSRFLERYFYSIMLVTFFWFAWRFVSFFCTLFSSSVIGTFNASTPSVICTLLHRFPPRGNRCVTTRSGSLSTCEFIAWTLGFIIYFLC